MAALTRQKERLVAYSTQARYAVAQLYDRANEPTDARATEPTTEQADANKDADHAGKP